MFRFILYQIYGIPHVFQYYPRIIKTYPKTKYIADFTYKKDGKLYVEDVKSEITRKDKTYRLKIKILLDRYKDIEFREIM